MDLSIYLGKKVQIILKSGFTYIGFCDNADSNSISMIDKNGSHVQLKEDSIDLIKEVGR